MLFARQNSLPFQSLPQQTVLPQSPTGPSGRIAGQCRSDGMAIRAGTAVRVVLSTAKSCAVSAKSGKGCSGVLPRDFSTPALAGAGCNSTTLGVRGLEVQGLKVPGEGAERFAAKRNRHALELLGACMMIASFLALALFA